MIVNKAAMGAVLTGIATLIGTITGRGLVPPVLHLPTLVSFICFGICALLRMETNCRHDSPKRWRWYVWAGLAFGAFVIASQGAISLWHWSPIPSRWLTFALALSVVLITSGMISRYYILPNTLAMQAGYRLGLHHRETIQDLVGGDEKLADDVLEAIDRQGIRSHRRSKNTGHA